MVTPIVDLGSINPTEVVVPDEELRLCLPQDHEFRVIDEIRHIDEEQRIVVGRSEVGAEPWWARGHIPGRPLMPGVLIVEGCAQIAAVLVARLGVWPSGTLMGLGGIDKARFRKVIEPPATLWFTARVDRLSHRFVRHTAQCVVDDEIAAEIVVLGVPL